VERNASSDVRVEVRPALFHHEVDGVLKIQSAPVWAVAGQCIEDIRHGAYPPQQRDALPRQPFGAAAAVPSLVMRDGNDLPGLEHGRGGAPQYARPNDGMPLHYVPFGAAELARFAQDRVGYPDLAHVVHDAGVRQDAGFLRRGGFSTAAGICTARAGGHNVRYRPGGTDGILKRRIGLVSTERNQ